MTSKRDKIKHQRAQEYKQLESVTKQPKEEDRLFLELGKYCFDLSKLACGAFVLTNILDVNPYNKADFGWGVFLMALSLIAGIILIKLGSKK